MKWVVAAIIIVLIVGVGIFLMSKNNSYAPSSPQQTASPTEAMKMEMSPTVVMAASGTQSATQGNVDAFAITASNFQFSMPQISAKKGDTVKVTLTVSRGFHDISFPDFNVTSKQIGPGQQDTIQFVASKTGTFDYYCTIDHHREMGMAGKLVVE